MIGDFSYLLRGILDPPDPTMPPKTARATEARNAKRERRKAATRKATAAKRMRMAGVLSEATEKEVVEGGNSGNDESILTEINNTEYEELEQGVGSSDQVRRMGEDSEDILMGGTKNGEATEGWPETPETPQVANEEEEVERDVTKIGLPETPAIERQTDVYQSSSGAPRYELLSPTASERKLIPISALRERIRIINDDDEKYNLLRTWLMEKLQGVHGLEEQIAEAWEVAQTVPNFRNRRREDLALWNQVSQIRKRTFDTNRRVALNWDKLREKLGPDAVYLLQEAGNGWSFTTNLRKLFEGDVTSAANRLCAAVVKRLREMRPGVSAYRGVRPNDVSVARSLPEQAFTDQDLAALGLQEGPDRIPEPMGRQRPALPENVLEPNGTSGGGTGSGSGSGMGDRVLRKHGRLNYSEEPGNKGVEGKCDGEQVDSDEAEADRQGPVCFNSMDLSPFRWAVKEKLTDYEGMLDEAVFGELYGGRRDLLEDLAQHYSVLLDDTEWLDWSFGTSNRSLREMAREEYEVYLKHTDDVEAESVFRLRTMWYSIVQQVLRMDPGMYALTVYLRDDQEFRLMGYPEPAVHHGEDDNKATIFLQSNPTQYRKPDGDVARSTEEVPTWSPVIWQPIIPGENDLWLVPLTTGAPPGLGVELKWGELSRKHGKRAEDAEQVIRCDEDELCDLVLDGGQFREGYVPLIHPVVGVGMSGRAGRSLVFPYRFVPEQQYREIINKGVDLIPPGILPSGKVIPENMQRRWPPTVRVRPARALCLALSGILSWDDPAVQMDLQRLFHGTAAEITAFINKVRGELYGAAEIAFAEFKEAERRMYGD